MSKLNSIVIRHGRPKKPWNSMGYEELSNLLLGRDDIDVDLSYISNELDMEKVLDLNAEKVVSSKSKRAIQTARFIAKIIGIDLEIVEGLDEIRVDLPEEIYNQGSDAVRRYVIREGEKSGVVIDISILSENALIVSHSFLTRMTYAKLFGKKPLDLLNDKRFTDYLSGFRSSDGEFLTLLREHKNVL